MRESLVSSTALDDDLAKRWRAAVHDYVRALRDASVDRTSFHAPGPGWNYYSVRVEIGETAIRLLLNAATRLVAASRDDGVARIGPLEFVDLEAPESFRSAGFVVPTAEDLLKPLVSADLLHLSPAERRSIEYFRPDRVGDIVFNWFD